jgi:hypothetical protein
VIGPNSEIGPRGLTWGVKANFLKQFFNAWGTRSDTARAPKIGCYKNGRPFLGLGAVSKNPLKNIFFVKNHFFSKSAPLDGGRIWTVKIPLLSFHHHPLPLVHSFLPLLA